jgi:hypothetical protein
VQIADARKVKGLDPLACKTDRIDAWVLAELARGDLVPAIWLPDPLVRAERERARWRLHLVRHRSSLKQRVHAVLLIHGKPCPVSDLFRVRGRQLLTRLGLPQPGQDTIDASLRLIDELEREISVCRCCGRCPESVGCSPTRSPPRSATIGRFATPRKLAGYSPRVYQSGERDLLGPLSKQGPRYLRWALVEAATHACTAPAYADRLFQYREIGRLPDAPARAALVGPAATLGVEFEEKAARQVVRESAGYPYFIQDVLELWNHAEQSPIGLADLDTVREIVTDSLERSFFGPRFQLASDAEQRYLAAMAALGEPPYRSSEVAGRYGAKDTRGVSVFRESLIQKGLVWSPRRGQVDFTVPLFAEFLRQNHPLASFDDA